MRSMIVCPEPLAARTGQGIFEKGGNAIDAAVAAAFVQGVVNPLLCGLGGTGLLYYYDAREGRRIILDFGSTAGSSPVPQSWIDEYVGRAETVGRHIIRSEANQVGHQSIMTPGFVKGCWDAYRRFGSGHVSWAELLAPSVKLARDGFEVYPYIAAFWKVSSGGDASDARPGYPGLMAKLNATPDAARFYLKPDGSPYQAGDWFQQPEMAATLERLAAAGGDDFYTGEIGRHIAADFAKHAALITTDDIREYLVDDAEPVAGNYHGLEVTSAPAPSSGANIIQMLQILEHFDLGKLGHNSPDYIDMFARIQRATFADNVKLKCMDRVDAAGLESEIVAATRAAYWADRVKRGDRIAVRGGAVDPGTTHLTAVDAHLNAVCFTHSLGSIAGSGVITSGLGFLYNNFLGHYNPLPGKPDSITPRKRFGGGVPTIIFDQGRPRLAIGAPGGSRLITSVVEVIVNALDYGMDMRAAVTAPRFHSEEEQLLFLEPAFPESTAEALREKGNDVQRSTYMSRVQAIRVDPETREIEAGPDPRGGGGVGAYPPASSPTSGNSVSFDCAPGGSGL